MGINKEVTSDKKKFLDGKFISMALQNTNYSILT
jgi:hypothetical protein